MAVVSLDVCLEEALRIVIQCSATLDNLCALGELAGNSRVDTRAWESVCMQLDIASAVFSAELFGGSYDQEIARVEGATRAKLEA